MQEESDGEMRELAQAELDELVQRKAELEQRPQGAPFAQGSQR